MSYRPRFLAAFVVCLGFTSSCSLEVDLRGSNFTCADGRCPTGMECNADELCVFPGLDVVDAAPPDEGDAEPPDPVIDAGAIDAADEVDAAAIDAGDPLIPCVGDKAVTDPSNGHCFRLIAEAGSFSEAKLACQVLGGHLAIIESDPENAVVQSLDDGSIATAWIGGSDQAVEGTWRWVDGSAFVYDNWNGGEPNNSGTNGEDCATVRFLLDGVWDDKNCSLTLPFVCELE